MTLTRTTAWSAALATIVIPAVVVAAGVAVAEPSSGTAEPFGQHVRVCAQEMGFDGRHNPGMHRGASPSHSAHHSAHHSAGHPGEHHC